MTCMPLQTRTSQHSRRLRIKSESQWMRWKPLYISFLKGIFSFHRNLSGDLKLKLIEIASANR